MTVSLCFLSFNRRNFLPNAIETAVRYADEPVEVICHDDGSSDPDLVSWLNGALGRGLISTLITNPPGHNQGQGVALNRMFHMATGDVIAKLDHDITFKPGWLRTARGILAQAPTTGVLWPVFRAGKKVAETLLDETSIPTIERFAWRLQDNGYVVTQRGDVITYMHKLIGSTMATGSPATRSRRGQHTDHINRVRLDNRRQNLRVVPSEGNKQNLGSWGATSKYRGVSWVARERKWVATAPLVVGQSYGRQRLGVYVDEIEAAEAVEAWRRINMPFATPDPLLFDKTPPPIGMLGLYRYHHEPVDCAKTILSHADGWERHSHICGCAFLMPRVAWRSMGSFEEHSDAFAEDFIAQQWIHQSGLWCCALPTEDLVTNHGFGIGPSTVVIAGPDGQPEPSKIHHGPYYVDGRTR